MAVEFDGGVVVGADSRTSSGNNDWSPFAFTYFSQALMSPIVCLISLRRLQTAFTFAVRVLQLILRQLPTTQRLILACTRM